MHSPFFRTSSLLFSAALILIFPARGNAQEKSEPQLVRVIYAQGEVKFSPGKNGKPKLESDWLQADVGLTLQQGYTLATENGRAAVEFENGSVVYLAEKSVLQFEKLQIKAGVTTTRLNLFTGTATIAHVSKGHDEISLFTPTMKITSSEAMTVRLDSSLNGSVVRSLDPPLPPTIAQPNKSRLLPGAVVVYVQGFRYQVKGPIGSPNGDVWDQWVDAQRLEREAEIEKGLQESGLKEPIPGLADLARNGRFIDCPPYGKCWQPNAPPSEDQQAPPGPAAGNSSALSAPNGPRPFVINRTLVSRCPMQTWMYSLGRPSVPGLLNASEPEETFTVSSFPWSGCFAGSWVADSCWNYGGYSGYGCLQGGWLYVVGPCHRHHPIWRVHAPRGFGFVPRHPLDRSGKPPINAKHGIFVLAFEKNAMQARLEPAPAKSVHLESSLPRAFTETRTLISSVPKVTPPVIQGRIIQVASNQTELQKEIQAGGQLQNQIHYDYKSKNFLAPRGSSVLTGSGGSRTTSGSAVVAHVGSHGVSGGVSGHSSGGSSGGPVGGHSGGGSSGGSGGGGGGHSGGGGSSSAGSSSGGGGGGHH